MELIINKIKEIIRECGGFSTGEIYADCSPCVFSGYGITVLAEYFNEDSVEASSYIDGESEEFATSTVAYEDLGEDTLADILTLCEQWHEETKEEKV